MTTILDNNITQISIFENAKDKHPSQVGFTKPELVELLTRPDIRDKKDGPAFSPAVFKEGTTRSNENVLSLNLIVLDVDGGNKEAVIKYCTENKLSCIIYSTFSNAADCECFRIVFELSRPVLPHEWKAAWAAICHKTAIQADAATRDLARIYYTHSCPASRESEKFVHVIDDGSPVDVDALLALNPPPIAPSTKKSSGPVLSKTAREIAEEVKTKHFHGQLWYFHEDFRVYHEGYWRQLDVKIDVMKAILTEYPELGAQQVKEVTETLKLLTAGRRDESGVEHADRDCDVPQLICVSNGTLNPVTGILQQHSPNPRLLSALKLAWLPDAVAPRFMQFLEEIWGDEPDFQQRVDFLQEFMGYILYPSNEFERFLWLTGAGANGKSVLLEIMAAIAGPENTTHLHLDRLGRPAVRATLEGKMLNISSEMNAGSTLADGHLKSITSGETMDAEPKFKAPFSFRPTIKLVSATNVLPYLKDTSGGFARRAVILSFNRVLAEHERDVDLKRKLLEELPGILVWAVGGLQRLLARGKFVPPASSEKLVAEYRTESDSVALFNHECLVPCKKGTPVGDLYAEYREFCATGGFCPTNKSVFGKRLMDLGIGMLGKSMGKPIRAARLRTAADNGEAVSAADTNPDENVIISKERTKVSFEEMCGSIEIEPASNDALKKAVA